MISNEYISVRGAREHNLKNLNIDVPKHKLVVVTGVSGSGKSSFAFDTLYAEGQRRYMESLSSYARQFLPNVSKPDIDSITGIPPSICIDQKTISGNIRSTVGTITEIYDNVRLIFATIGRVFSPATGEELKKQSPSEIVQFLNMLPEGSKIRLCAPVVFRDGDSYYDNFLKIKSQGYRRLKVDDKLLDLDNGIPKLSSKKNYNVQIIVDRIVIGSSESSRISASIELCLSLSDGLVNIDVVSIGSEDLESVTIKSKEIKKKDTVVMSDRFACPISGFFIQKIEPNIFSFASPFGVCTHCSGTGKIQSVDIESAIPDQSLSLNQGAIKPWEEYNTKYYKTILDGLAKHYGFSLDMPYESLDEKHKDKIVNGSGSEKICFDFRYDDSKGLIYDTFKGVREYMLSRMESFDDSDENEDYKIEINCPECLGFRIKKDHLNVKVNNKHIGEVCSLDLSKALDWFSDLSNHISKNEAEIALNPIKEIKKKLNFLIDVGLKYLSISRSADTLSGGESQRVRLASQIGSGLSDVLYVLDEPSIGLHARDNSRLIKTLTKLRDEGNSVVVVEHDHEMIESAEYVIDIGPEAGTLGGNLIFTGDVKGLLECKDSITGRFLSYKEKIDLPKERRKYNEHQCLEIINASGHNLKNINVKIPTSVMVVITGVSGSGKSSLIIDTLYPILFNKIHKSRRTVLPCDGVKKMDLVDKVIKIGQGSIGRTPRSNPATYTGMFNHIRDLYTMLPESRSRGYKPGRFSFNVKGGRCENCQGDGVIRVSMYFLPDVYVTCDVCDGKRYNSETLEVEYKGKSISDVLDMSVYEAYEFFKDNFVIAQKVKALIDCGVGYIKIGQTSTTISGGESQRIKLAKEICRKSTGSTLYLLDEPSTGLHTRDIKCLLNALQLLVESGNTVLLIEHHLDIIATADHVIEIGPEGGEEGGYIIASGTPEDLAKSSTPTSDYLKLILNKLKK